MAAKVSSFVSLLSFALYYLYLFFSFSVDLLYIYLKKNHNSPSQSVGSTEKLYILSINKVTI